jgi:hypothetical protein
MNDEFDYELTPDQWEALKALRTHSVNPPRTNGFAVESLMTLGLVAMSDGSPVITPRGRRVLIRGSSQLLLDLAV